MKKLFFTLLPILLAIFLSMGCITKNLWRDKVKAKPYKEHIISFYGNKKEGRIVFIGEKYHYIFNKGTKELIELLDRKRDLNLKEEFRAIRATISEDNRDIVKVNITFQFKKEDLTKEQEKFILDNKNMMFIGGGGKDNNETELYGYLLSYNLLGQRYRATAKVNSQVVKLKNPIDIEILGFEVVNKKSTLYKVAMTPITVVADATLIVVGAGVAIIISPFALGYSIYDSMKK